MPLESPGWPIAEPDLGRFMGYVSVFAPVGHPDRDRFKGHYVNGAQNLIAWIVYESAEYRQWCCMPVSARDVVLLDRFPQGFQSWLRRAPAPWAYLFEDALKFLSRNWYCVAYGQLPAYVFGHVPDLVEEPEDD